MEVDETICGALCQHPSCWASNHRLSKNVPHKTCKRPTKIPEDEGLPTQNIVNMLADYGADPEDRYPPTGVKGPSPPQDKPSASSRKYSDLRKSSGESSFPRLKAPMATPSSMAQIASPQVSPRESAAPPRINRVEVQEVFDLDDLHSKWQDTFVARQYYVWVPNPKATNKDSQRQKQAMENTSKSMPSGPLVDSIGSVVPRDMTEAMIPREVEWERRQTKMKRVKSPSSPQQGRPTNKALHPTRSNNYYGIYELLDLPKDVLLRVLEHIDRRDLMDRERLAEALTRAFPKLEYENSSLAMAYGDVLQQRKLSIRDLTMSSKSSARGPMKEAKQLQLVDQYARDPEVAAANRHGLIATPGAVMVPITASPASQKLPSTPVIMEDMKRHPLPSIPATKEHPLIPPRPKAAAISLGLPSLPSGVKITKPFTYKGKNFDLSLGPVPAPAASTITPPTTPIQDSSRMSPTQRVLLAQTEGQARTTSPVSTARESSTIHVKMPKVAEDLTEIPYPGRDSKGNQLSITDAGHTPLHAISPSYSTHVPKTPAGTPATRNLTSNARDEVSALSNRQTGSGSMITSAGGSHVPGITSEATGLLGTIHEADTADQDSNSLQRSRSDLPKSQRSVRFAEDFPPQPPSSPDLSERPDSAQKFHRNDSSIVNNFASDTKELTQTSIPASHLTKMTSSSPTGASPELWPTVDEEAYKNMPSTQQSMALTASTSLPEGDQSLAAQYDQKSELSGLTSAIQSRENTFQMNKKLKDDLAVESPGPPPPSPEPPRDRKVPMSRTSSNSKLVESSVNLDDIIDSDSEMTISAKPPSNLDDFSRIQTPATPMNNDSTPRDNTTLAPKPFLPTIFSEEARSQDLHSKTTTSSDEVLEHRKLLESRVSGSMNPESQIQDPDSQNGVPTDLEGSVLTKRSSIIPPEITIIPGTRPASEQGSTPTEKREIEIVGESENVTRSNHVAPQNPAYPLGVEKEGEQNDMQRQATEMDMFDTSEDAFQEELKNELDRLNSDQTKAEETGKRDSEEPQLVQTEQEREKAPKTEGEILEDTETATVNILRLDGPNENNNDEETFEDDGTLEKSEKFPADNAVEVEAEGKQGETKHESEMDSTQIVGDSEGEAENPPSETKEAIDLPKDCVNEQDSSQQNNADENQVQNNSVSNNGNEQTEENVLQSEKSSSEAAEQ